jgi:aminotransferase
LPSALARLPEQFFTRLLAAAAAERSRPGVPFADLGRGNPDAPPPAHAIAALTAAAQEQTAAVHGYPPFGGLPSLREAIAERYAADHGVTLDPEREVAVVPGTKTGIMLVALAAAGAGETVLLPDPGYPDYRSGVALAGAAATALPLDPAGAFQPDWAAVAGLSPALTVLNYPSNPCAACVRDGTFETAVAYAADRGGWLLHDLAYDGLAFDGHRARSVLEADGARDVAVELWSPSKAYGMAGWRIGFCVGNAELVGRVQALIDHTTAACGPACSAASRRRCAATRRRSASAATRTPGGATCSSGRCARPVRSSPRPRGRSTRGGACPRG